MTAGDGLAVLGIGIAAAGMMWALVWGSVRLESIRAEALRRLGEPTWQTKTTTKQRPA